MNACNLSSRLHYTVTIKMSKRVLLVIISIIYCVQSVCIHWVKTCYAISQHRTLIFPATTIISTAHSHKYPFTSHDQPTPINRVQASNNNLTYNISSYLGVLPPLLSHLMMICIQYCGFSKILFIKAAVNISNSMLNIWVSRNSCVLLLVSTCWQLNISTHRCIFLHKFVEGGVSQKTGKLSRVSKNFSKK